MKTLKRIGKGKNKIPKKDKVNQKHIKRRKKTIK